MCPTETRWQKANRWYRRSRKTVVAVVAAVVGWGQLVVQSKPTAITAPEWMLLATGLLGALGVYHVTNSAE